MDNPLKALDTLAQAALLRSGNSVDQAYPLLRDDLSELGEERVFPTVLHEVIDFIEVETADESSPALHLAEVRLFDLSVEKLDSLYHWFRRVAHDHAGIEIGSFSDDPTGDGGILIRTFSVEIEAFTTPVPLPVEDVITWGSNETGDPIRLQWGNTELVW